MADLTEFKQYNNLADQLIEAATKEELSACLKVLAMYVADYQMRFGELPMENTVAMLSTDKLDDEHAAMLRDGMELLVGVLGGAMSGLGEGKH